jgi:hypothetical protein
LLKTVANEIAMCKLDLVGVQEVSWDEGTSQPVDEYTILPGNRSANHHLGTGFFVHQEIISSVKSVSFFY